MSTAEMIERIAGVSPRRSRPLRAAFQASQLQSGAAAAPTDCARTSGTAGSSTPSQRTPGAAQQPFRYKFVGVYYLLTILTGAFVLFFHGRLAFAADLTVSVFYIGITAFFYVLSR